MAEHVDGRVAPDGLPEPVRRPTFANVAEAAAQAREIAPRLRERVPEAESLRRLPDETVRDLVDTGLLSLLVPRSMGGSELNYDAVLEVTATLGAACPSTGWVYALWTAHLWMIAQFPEHVQAEVFAGRPTVSSVVNTVGDPQKVDGGWRWSGRGFFSSGVDHCRWLTPAISSPGPDGEVARRWYLIPRSEIEIVDDWFTMGLKATGSKSIVVKDVFIPDDHVLLVKDLSAGKSPGAALHPGVLYHAGVEFTYSLPVAMPAIGAARGFVHAFQERVKPRIEGANQVLANEALTTLPQLALAASEIDSAYAVLLQDVQRFCFKPAAEFTALDHARCRRDTSYSAQTCRRAVNKLFESSGGSSLYDSAEMQRLWRDTNAAAAHHGLTWAIRGTEYGRVLVGLPANPQGL